MYGGGAKIPGIEGMPGIVAGNGGWINGNIVAGGNAGRSGKPGVGGKVPGKTGIGGKAPGKSGKTGVGGKPGKSGKTGAGGKPGKSGIIRPAAAT